MYTMNDERHNTNDANNKGSKAMTTKKQRVRILTDADHLGYFCRIVTIPGLCDRHCTDSLRNRREALEAAKRWVKENGCRIERIF